MLNFTHSPLLQQFSNLFDIILHQRRTQEITVWTEMKSVASGRWQFRQHFVCFQIDHRNVCVSRAQQQHKVVTIVRDLSYKHT